MRDRHTCLLASFDAVDTNDAEYARNERREVGVGNQPDAPGRFGGGVAVTGSGGCVMFPGLDNYDPRRGTVEFWAQVRGDVPLWRDGQEHWLLVLYPERAGASPRYGMSPTFVTLCKTKENVLELRIVNTAAPSYAAAPSLRTGPGWSVAVNTDQLATESWHHIVCSWDLAGTGRAWLLIDGQGLSAELNLPRNQPAPNPGGLIVFGGLWGLPGDGVETSNCNLDDLRIEASTVLTRLEGNPSTTSMELDDDRLMTEEDLARAMLDQLLKLQFHGGWEAGYHWPTYTPSGWSLVGRGVDMWFAHSSEAAQALLRGWMIWRDDRYLDGAIEAADMFCRTQMENGSWAYHYTYSRGEFQRWGDHAYIAQAMQSNQIRFLCLMSRQTGYDRYQQAVRRVGDWMVSIQFPSGAWGWEAYPLGKTGPHGHPALNDAVTPQAMHDLFVIWCATGDDKYLQPILQGANWIMAAQAGAPTYGWADQYNEKNEFIWMRNFEPPAVSIASSAKDPTASHRPHETPRCRPLGTASSPAGNLTCTDPVDPARNRRGPLSARPQRCLPTGFRAVRTRKAGMLTGSIRPRYRAYRTAPRRWDDIAAGLSRERLRRQTGDPSGSSRRTWLGFRLACRECTNREQDGSVACRPR